MDVDRDADKVDFSQYGTSVRVSTALFVAGVTLTPGLHYSMSRGRLQRHQPAEAVVI